MADLAWEYRHPVFFRMNTHVRNQFYQSDFAGQANEWNMCYYYNMSKEGPSKGVNNTASMSSHIAHQYAGKFFAPTLLSNDDSVRRLAEQDVPASSTDARKGARCWPTPTGL